MYDWWKQLKKSALYKVCKTNTEAGKKEDDHAAPPLYPDVHVVEIVRSLLKIGTSDSICRAFAILTGVMSAGRSSESSYILRDSFEWDYHLKCAFFECPMIKVAAYKQLPFVPAALRHLDWYFSPSLLNWFDHFLMSSPCHSWILL